MLFLITVCFVLVYQLLVLTISHSLVVIHHMYNEYGQLSPGGLTLLKVSGRLRMMIIVADVSLMQGSMVTNTALAAVCVETGLHEHIIHDSTALTEGVKEYSKILWKARTTEYGLAKEENRMPGQYWADIDPPKVILSDWRVVDPVADLIPGSVGCHRVSSWRHPCMRQLRC